MDFNRNIIVLICFVSAYMLAAVGFAWRTQNFEFLIYSLVTALVISGVVFAHKRIGFTDLTLWLLAVWGLLHMAGGLVPVPETWAIEGDIRVLYSWWIIPDCFKYDNLVHSFGFGTTTWCCWQGLQATVRTRRIRPTLGRLTLVVMAAMGFSALNEIFEFMAVLFVPTTNVGGYVNTCWDLVYNMLGCLIAALTIKLSYNARH